MNNHERKMLDVLKKGRDEFGFVGVKAEFEAEGTRMDEMHRLVDLTRRAGLNLGIKIGGCEAVSDLYTCRQLGADYIIAPMVETPYAVHKYIGAKNKAYLPEERPDTRFLFNLETKTGYANREELGNAAVVKDGADGIVFGRVDFSESMGLGRDGIGTEQVTNCVLETAKICKARQLDLVVGGGVAVDTIDALKTIHSVYLSRFETRKVIFTADALTNTDVIKGMTHAVHFELLWLRAKRDYYITIGQEDAKRLDMLESRWSVLSKELEAA